MDAHQRVVTNLTASNLAQITAENYICDPLQFWLTRVLEKFETHAYNGYGSRKVPYPPASIREAAFQVLLDKGFVISYHGAQEVLVSWVIPMEESKRLHEKLLAHVERARNPEGLSPVPNDRSSNHVEAETEPTSSQTEGSN